MRDREILARDGFLIAMILIDKETGELVDEPEIITRGFVFVRDASGLIETAQTLIEEIVGTHEKGNLTVALEDALSKFFYNQTKRRPMIFAYVREV